MVITRNLYIRELYGICHFSSLLVDFPLFSSPSTSISDGKRGIKGLKASSLKKLHLKSEKSKNKTLQSFKLTEIITRKKQTPGSLVNLCLGVLGQHLEDIIKDFDQPDIKMTMMAIVRRRKLLNDDIFVALADTSWDILDISESYVSDFGLKKAAVMLKTLRAVDISRCSKITALDVSELVCHCCLLETLRWRLHRLSSFRACAQEALLMLKGSQLGGQSIDFHGVQVLPINRSHLVERFNSNPIRTIMEDTYGYNQGYEAYGFAPPPQDPSMYSYGAYPAAAAGCGGYLQQPQQQ